MHRNRTMSPLILAILAAGVAGSAVAQPPSAPIRIPASATAPPASLTLDATIRAEVIDSLEACLIENYVEADTARMIASLLDRKKTSGAYDAITDPRRLCEVVTDDLRKLNGDLHLSLRYEPNRTGPPTMIVMGGGPGATPATPGAPAPRDTVDPQIARAPWFRTAQRQNYGLSKLEILPGNVGYLKIDGFMGAPGSDAVVADAMRFVERTDAVIIDVRENHGGSGEMSHLTFSHFLPAEPVATIKVKSRATAEPEVMHSLAQVPGPRRPDVPLYVLTSRATGSAAEEFTFVLKNLGRATIVGERTAGAGHMVNAFDLPRGFVAGVSITRVSDARTGREWEQVGVQPDMAVAPDHALAVAHAAALRTLSEVTDDPQRRRELEWQSEWMEAKDRAEPVNADQLVAAPGAYEGDRTITARDGRLYFQRGPLNGELIPIGDRRYLMNGTARLTFDEGSPAPALLIERLDGSSSRCARTGAAAR